MSRIPFLMLLSVLSLAGCSPQSGTTGNGGGTSSSSSSSTSTSSSGTVNPDPGGQPTVGIPDQLSMSLSVSQHSVNCLTGHDGATIDATIRLADRLNNHSTIPDTTTVYFAAEGGSIVKQCTTTDGACTVKWRCQDNRPADGRVTLVAWTEGNESFNDNNGNGFFDEGSPDPDTMVAGTDRGEAFVDANENGIRDTDEPFVDYPNPTLVAGGDYDGPDGLYAGINCAYPGQCAEDQSLFIYDENIVIMAAGDTAPAIIPIRDTGTGYDLYTSFPIDLSATSLMLFLVADVNGNPLPVGSKVDFSLEGDAGEFLGETADTVGDSAQTAINGPPWTYAEIGDLVHSVRMIEVDNNATDEYGFLLVTVEVDENSTQVPFDVFDPQM